MALNSNGHDSNSSGILMRKGRPHCNLTCMNRLTPYRTPVSFPVPIPDTIGSGCLDICEDCAFHEHLDHGVVLDDLAAASQQRRLLIHQMVLGSARNVSCSLLQNQPAESMEQREEGFRQVGCCQCSIAAEKSAWKSPASEACIIFTVLARGQNQTPN